MTGGRVVIMEITRIEAAHLVGLVQQFIELLEGTDRSGAPVDDPAIARLVPSAYSDDAEAASEFRALTQSDLLSRRDSDARVLLTSLGSDDLMAEEIELDDPRFTEVITVTLSPDEVRSWMRTLAAVRLVLATRLGIDTEDTHDDEDARFGIYDWLGYRLDGLVQAASATY